MKVIRHGCTRIVFLIGNYAVKVPNVFEWRLFLHGLLANMQERTWASMEWGKDVVCPVPFSLRGGWLVVMRRAVELTDAEFEEFMEVEYFQRFDTPDYLIPAEKKSNSFGWLDGRIVAIDYGN